MPKPEIFQVQLFLSNGIKISRSGLSTYISSAHISEVAHETAHRHNEYAFFFLLENMHEYFEA